MYNKIQKWVNKHLATLIMCFGFIMLIGSFLVSTVLEEKQATHLTESTAPLLSVASFLILLAGILMQKKELELQREELMHQRQELKETREVFKQQNLLMNQQGFETTFFNLINSHHKIVEDMIINNRNNSDNTFTQYQGRRAIRFIKFILTQHTDSRVFKDKETLLDIMNSEVDKIINEFSYAIDHYFKNIYSIIKMIDLADEKIIKREIYINIFLSSISSDEKYLIYYFGHTYYGRELLEIIEKYDPELRSFVEYDDIKQLYRVIKSD